MDLVLVKIPLTQIFSGINECFVFLNNFFKGLFNFKKKRVTIEIKYHFYQSFHT